MFLTSKNRKFLAVLIEDDEDEFAQKSVSRLLKVILVHHKSDVINT